MIGWNKFRDLLKRLKAWGNKDVEIHILNLNKKIGEKPRQLEKIAINGVIEDESERHIVKIGGSYHISHPEGWLGNITNVLVAKTQLVQLNGSDKKVIVISEPQKEEQKT